MRSTAGSVVSRAAPTGSRSSSAPRTTAPRSRCSPAAPHHWRHQKAFPTRRVASSATATCEPTSVCGCGFLVAGRVALLSGAAAVAVLRRGLAPSAAVVGRVEAGALVMHRDREQHLLDGARAAGLAAFGRSVAHLLEELELVAVRATVLVHQHQGANLPAKLRREALC